MNTDAELLTRFAATGDEAAFRGIVERHAPMVQGVAWRRTQDRALSEEITQTVFTILARKASGLRHSELAGWLHRAAFMETRNACRRESRRGEALRELTNQMSGDSPDDNAWQDIQPHLDEALSRLPNDERQLVVMRYFEQRSYREIADTTGKSEEASRKQMQRSLDRLGSLLRRRGIVTSGAALAAVLGGQSLCVPSASAALISSSALHSASTVTTSTLLTNTFFAMTASTVLKTSIVTLALAAIPITMLWQENSTLKKEVRELRLASTETVNAKASPVLAARDAAAKTAKPSASGGTAAGAVNPASPFAGMLQGDNLINIAATQMKQEASREVNRLALRLKLTAEQKEKLTKFLEDKHQRSMDRLKHAVETGLLTRAMKGTENLSEEDQKLLAELEADDHDDRDLDPFLGTLLSQEQLAEYGKSKEEKRVAEAEERAHTTLSAIGKQVDLTEDQKDRLFQQMAQRELTAKKPHPGSVETDAGALTVNLAGSEFDRANDDVIRSILTPEQFETYAKSREEEERQAKEVMKLAAPWLPVKETGAEAK
ncbi:MAG TPA: sigma-70 family RNA polymerase sigma factor [Verrucomicrobiales bacterium]|jgi:RNA polymerase sigma factor (sigma-70 family)|nr:sigma-70 family RNA polymerase sigma factor [Verrucomicrobiales bacterium]